MQLRAFGVCPICSEIYPSARGCPRCDGDSVAAEQVRAARAVAIASAAESPLRGIRPAPARREHPFHGLQWKPVVAVISVSVVLSTLIAVLAQA